MKLRNLTPGLILIAIGAMLLLGNLDIITFDFGYIWPLFLLIPGIVQFITYFTRRTNPGNLVGATVTTTYGGLFLYLNHYGWDQMSYLWPLFITGVGLGLIFLYLADRQHQSIFPGLILTVFSLGYIGLEYYELDMSLLFPAFLIIIGLALIFKPRGKHHSRHVHVEYDFGGEKKEDNSENNEHVHVHQGDE